MIVLAGQPAFSNTSQHRILKHLKTSSFVIKRGGRPGDQRPAELLQYETATGRIAILSFPA